MRTLTDKTLVPIGLAVSVIGGGAMWLTKIHLTQDAYGRTLSEVRETIAQDRNSFYNMLLQIEKRLSGIEGELKRIKR